MAASRLAAIDLLPRCSFSSRRDRLLDRPKFVRIIPVWIVRFGLGVHRTADVGEVLVTDDRLPGGSPWTRGCGRGLASQPPPRRMRTMRRCRRILRSLGSILVEPKISASVPQPIVSGDDHTSAFGSIVAKRGSPQRVVLGWGVEQGRLVRVRPTIPMVSATGAGDYGGPRRAPESPQARRHRKLGRSSSPVECGDQLRVGAPATVRTSLLWCAANTSRAPSPRCH